MTFRHCTVNLNLTEWNYLCSFYNSTSGQLDVVPGAVNEALHCANGGADGDVLVMEKKKNSTAGVEYNSDDTEDYRNDSL